ncbi:caspase family protein [Sulfitobacter sabulilitoris]|uniref:Caspase family protein n=1 Tax=Sulfitobacter sabulilitoris TaxID=2562655 RepID=A0A5S3PID5_9RHOB|nr:caspase family protein [Sulfitobacter sabulilitoris]TMM54119.1 caspase family protein [Sulfitobacter sabulilitoris]
MMTSFRFFAPLMLALWSTAVWAEPRIALIVGNGSYTSVTTLDNTVPDAELMARTLTAQGFDVTILTDTDQATLNAGISQFGRDLRAAGQDATGLFYYAGHAVQSFGTNFLLPTDTLLTDAADLSLVAVQADAVLRQMRSARNKTNIVILDACRNNPFKAIRDLNDNGLAEMNAPTGTFLSYSTAPGAVALDGLDGNSPFTKALAREIPAPGVPIEQTFKKVRVAVIDETNGQQTPWDTSSLTGEFMFEPETTLSAEELQEQQLWASVQQSDDPVQIMLFLRGYPNGRYQDDARALLNVLMAEELAPKPQATPEPATPVIAAPAPAPAPQGPTATEEALIATAQSLGTAEAYQAYLDAFPQGIYAELVAFELGVIAQKAQRTDDTPNPTAGPVETAALNRAVAPESDANALSGLTYVMPFPIGGPPIEGQTIEQITGLSPLFAPIVGLPESLWKDQKCSSCHEWTREALCTQGKTYVSAPDDTAVTKKHPFGGVFKKGLRGWAGADCP